MELVFCWLTNCEFKGIGIYLILAALGACLPGCAIEGLHDANPKSIFQIDPVAHKIYFYDNKDNDLEVEGLFFKGDANKRELKIDELKLLNNASAVRRANVEQIDALARESTAILQGLTSLTGAVGNLATSMIPILGGLQRSPIWGSGQAGALPPGWTATEPVYPPTATQPATPAEPANPMSKLEQILELLKELKK